MMNLSAITIAIIIANVLVSMKGFNDFSFFEKYKFQIGPIKRGEQIRMLTSGFLHVDSRHLLFNMLTLYFFADIVIYDFGQGRFLIVYMVSLLFGSLLALGFHKDEYHYSAVGASGAVMGIIYAAILLFPEMRIYGFIPGWVFGIGYLVYTIVGIKGRFDNIGHTAHFGGAIGGYVTTLIFKPSLITSEPLVVGLLAVPIIVLFILEKAGKLR
ncbi:rhomboid family intramembrane serine protease [Sungkyunkwania multivorans]|uniref:Rhomboid family intramembrane serine protease n=1 Tax=Sungkyunkwania multivorans TaxID=1173618 RepID=A0ABW3CW41_9FLAO